MLSVSVDAHILVGEDAETLSALSTLLPVADGMELLMCEVMSGDDTCHLQSEI